MKTKNDSFSKLSNCNTIWCRILGASGPLNAAVRIFALPPVSLHFLLMLGNASQMLLMTSAEIYLLLPLGPMNLTSFPHVHDI